MSAEVETTFQLGLVGKSPSPEYIQDDESASICPLIVASPSLSTAHFRVSSMDTLPISGKSSSPDFIGMRDPESSSICPLLTPSPTVADFAHPLDPLTSLAYEIKDRAVNSDLNLISRTESDDLNNPVGEYESFDKHRNSGSVSDEGGEQPLTFTAKLRNILPGDLAESSTSSSSSALQENTSCVQLLGNHHYQHLNTDKNDVISFIPQENGIKPSIDVSGQKLKPDYCFMSWNWPIIRKSCVVSVMSLMVACICIVVALVATLPRRCYPHHYWYQGTVFYEVFPASFQDTNADGIGDLKGIVERVKHFEELGVEAIRLNSIFPSDHFPEEFNKVKNLTGIEPSLGTLRDFSHMLDVLHSRNISVILDLPIYPLVKDLSELNILLKKDSSRKDVEGKITNIIHNHRSHRDVNNSTDDEIFPRVLPVEENSWSRIRKRAECCSDEHEQKIFDPRLLALKPEPYIDGGISGLMKHTSQHLNSITETVVADAIKFWFEIGVDGLYIKGLQHYVQDPQFEVELNKWRRIAYSHWKQNKEKLLMCDFEVYNAAINISEDKLNVVLNTMDLIDVYLDLSNGTENVKQQINMYQNSKVYDRKQFPWLHWNIGNVNTRRVSSEIATNGSLGAILFEMMLPGTVSIFYGDEIGLQDIHDPLKERHDIKHIHQLAPMVWKAEGTGFTRFHMNPWLPYAKSHTTAMSSHTSLIGVLSRVRNDSPSIYMNSIWKNDDNLMNYAVKYADKDIIVMERSYPRRNSFVVVANMGEQSVTKDLSHIYYGGEVIIDFNDVGEYITFKFITINPGESIVVKLDK